MFAPSHHTVWLRPIRKPDSHRRPARKPASLMRRARRPALLTEGPQIILLVAATLIAGCESAGPAGGPTLSGPRDEEVWAIRCITLHTPDRFRQADAYAAALKKVPGLRADQVQVISDDDGTAVFYGRYRREYGPGGPLDTFKPDARRDLETIRGLRFLGAEVWPFILATMDVLPTYRPARPEWNLAEAEGTWALHVAVFYNTDEFRTRRSAAEEYCALLRERGESAYYHHGAVNSSVYIGPFPFHAVTEVRQDDPLTGRVTTTYRIVDPEMVEAQRRFPISLHNGHTLYEVLRDASGGVRSRLPAPSFPVVIPKAPRPIERRRGT